MRFLGNAIDPNKDGAESKIVLRIGESIEEGFQRHKRFLSDKVIGLPLHKDPVILKQLIDFGYIGVYAPE